MVKVHEGATVERPGAAWRPAVARTDSEAVVAGFAQFLHQRMGAGAGPATDATIEALAETFRGIAGGVDLDPQRRAEAYRQMEQHLLRLLSVVMDPAMRHAILKGLSKLSECAAAGIDPAAAMHEVSKAVSDEFAAEKARADKR